MGRPPTLPAQLRDGFYIEVRSKTADKGVKIRAESEQEMMDNANIYKNSKEVTILGQIRKGVWLNQVADDNKKKQNGRGAKEKAAKEAAAKEKVAAKVVATKKPAPAKAPVKKEAAKAKPAKVVAKKAAKAPAKKKGK